MGYFNTSLFLGFGLGFILGGFLSHHFGMNASFYSMGAICLVAFFAILLLLPESHLEREGSEISPRKIIESDIGKALMSFRLSNSMARGIFSCFIPIFAGLSLGLDTAQIGTLLAVNTLLAGFFQMPLGRLADRFSRKGLVAAGNLVDMLFLLLIPHMYSFSQLLILCAVMSVGRPIAIPASSAIAATEGRKFGMGSSMGIFSMAMSIGMAVGPPLGGIIYDWVNLNFVFYFAATAELLGTIYFLRFMKKSK
jgi:MFS family permease